MNEQRPSSQTPGPPGSTPGSEYRQVDYEIQFRTLVILALGVVVLTLLSALGAYVIYQQLARAQAAAEAPPPPMEEARAPVTITGPVLRADPKAGLESFRRLERERLTSHQWVDAEAGVARIPIDSAIDLLVARGLPAEATHQPTAPASPYLGEAGSPPGASVPWQPEPEELLRDESAVDAEEEVSADEEDKEEPSPNGEAAAEAGEEPATGDPETPA